jgi:cytidine deaminase
MLLNDHLVQQMKLAAEAAAANAYCPYSRFAVGASVLTKSGEIVAGCNVENASYGLTICAERNALFQAISEGHREIVAVAIVTSGDAPTPPCGACRQVIHEFGANAEILSFGKDGTVLRQPIAELLPSAFAPGSGRDCLTG